jgi:hypothetical protein
MYRDSARDIGSFDLDLAPVAGDRVMSGGGRWNQDDIGHGLGGGLSDGTDEMTVEREFSSRVHCLELIDDRMQSLDQGGRSRSPLHMIGGSTVPGARFQHGSMMPVLMRAAATFG